MNSQESAFKPRRIVAMAFNKSVQVEWSERLQDLPGWIRSHNYPLTSEGQAIVDFCTRPGGLEKHSLMVSARAGTGKTYMAFRCMGAMNPSANIEAVTSHALGYRAWRDKIGRRVSSFDGKLRKIAKEWEISSVKADGFEDTFLGTAVIDLVKLAKNFGITPGDEGDPILEDTDANWEALADEYAKTFSPEILTWARRMLIESNLRATQGYRTQINRRWQHIWEVDFADMLYLPACYKGVFDRPDLVIPDEVQDFSSIQHRILEKLRTRILAFGDPYQAIYAFRGADSNSIDNMTKKFSMEILPLTKTFRCSKAVVAEAKGNVPDYQAADDNPEGSVIHFDGQVPLNKLKESVDTILCPYNAPIVKLALSCIANGIPAYIEGRDFGERLVKRVARITRGTDMDEDQFLTALAIDTERFLAKYPGKEDQQEDEDRVLRILLEKAPNHRPSEIANALERLYPSNGDRPKNYLRFSTIHKAKGLEWDRVGILDYGSIGRWDKKQWQFSASRNLRYVGQTRAITSLVYISLSQIGEIEDEPSEI